MAPKMYLLVEADQSQADPISKLMSQLVGQLKTTQKSSTCDEIVLREQGGAIHAEACIDPSGCTKAKIVVCTDKQPAAPAREPPPSPRENSACPKEESAPCGRRNGLDPTFSEQRGQKKFQYLPLKSKIPDYNAKKCPKPLIISDNLSQASSGDYRMKLTAPVIKGLRETCAKSITEARLQKYGACISRKNGLQDQCDPLSRRPIKRTCCAKGGGSGGKKPIRARPKRLYVRKTAEELDVLGPKKVSSRELRGGVLYTDCDCNRRNGLQHDCPRDKCAGDPKCLTEPWPECELGRYYRDKFAKHDGLRNKPPNPPRCVPFSNDFARRYVDTKKMV